MTIGVPVNLGSISSSAGGATLSITTTADAPVGSLISVWANGTTASGGPASGVFVPQSVADSAGNTYTAESGGNSGGIALVITLSQFCCIGSTSDLPIGSTITITYDKIGSLPLNALIVADAVSGVSSIDLVGTGSTGLSTTPSFSTGALSSPNEIIITGLIISSGGSDTFTEGAGFSSSQSVTATNALRSAYKLVTPTTSVTYAPTLGTSRTWVVSASSFVASAATDTLMPQIWM